MYYFSELSSYTFFTYISVRAGFAFFIALILSLFLMPKFVDWAKKKNASRPIYEHALRDHQIKSHTPTMRGVIFVFRAIFASLPYIKFDNLFTLMGLLCSISFCFIGVIDDLGKILKENNHSGLSPEAKIFGLIFASFLYLAPLYFSGILSVDFYIPFYEYPLFNIYIFALFSWILALISSSNAVNLTGGLDGPVIVPFIFSLAALGVFLYLSEDLVYSEYLFLPKINGLGELVVICAALIDTLMGFLWFNCYPAQIFMGDSGNLALGGFIGFLAVISKNEIPLLFAGFVFVLETISVILQVGSFKIWGKRVFKTAPIHHHFEKVGWVENKIIVRFWMTALLSSFLTLASLKLR